MTVLVSMRQRAWEEDVRLRAEAQRDDFLLYYDAVRTCAERARNEQKMPAAEAAVRIAHEMCLKYRHFSKCDALGLTVLVTAVLTFWEGPEGDNADFIAAMQKVYDDYDFSPALRAMAAEHLSSCYRGEPRKVWGLRARGEAGVGERDAQHLIDRTTLGEWDEDLLTFNESGISAALYRMVQTGYRDTPARVMWLEGIMQEFYADGGPNVRQRMVDLLQSVVDRADLYAHAFNRYHLGRVQKRLAELTAPEESSEE